MTVFTRFVTSLEIFEICARGYRPSGATGELRNGLRHYLLKVDLEG